MANSVSYNGIIKNNHFQAYVGVSVYIAWEGGVNHTLIPDPCTQLYQPSFYVVDHACKCINLAPLSFL